MAVAQALATIMYIFPVIEDFHSATLIFKFINLLL